MHKVTLDFSALKNEINRIHAEAYEGINVQDNNKRRDVLLKVIERLKSLKTNLESGNVKFEVK